MQGDQKICPVHPRERSPGQAKVNTGRNTLFLRPPHWAWGRLRWTAGRQKDTQTLVDTSDKMMLTGGVEEASGPK